MLKSYHTVNDLCAYIKYIYSIIITNSMIISHKYKFIFIKTRKTAGTSVESYLAQFCDKNDIIAPMESHDGKNHEGTFNVLKEIFYCIKDFEFRNRSFKGIEEDKFQTKKVGSVLKNYRAHKKFYNHIPAALVRARVSPDIWDNYFKFCIERNPWDKTISHYYFLKKGRKDYNFDDYMNEKKFCLNYPLYTDFAQNHIILDEVINYENLNSELSRIFEQLGIPFSGSLDTFAKSQYRKDKRPYNEFFPEEYETYSKVIEQVFQKEIELHGYKF